MAVSLRDIGFRLGYDLDKQSEAKVESSIKGLKSMATKMLGAIGVGFSLAQINALAEEFGGINTKISYAVKGLADEKVAQQAILKAANDTKTSYSAMADIVSDLAKSNTELFPVDDAVAFSTTVMKLMKVAGRSEQETQSMMDGLNKSFQKGIVDTETLNVMLEQCPEAANILSSSLGVAKSKLLDMATNGQISLQQLKDAFLNASGEIDKDFEKLGYSISDAARNIRNSWGYFIADFNKTFGITKMLARAVVRLSDTAIAAAQKIKTRLEWIGEKLGGAEKLTKLVGIAAAATCAVIVAQNATKILGFLGKALTGLTGIHKKTMATVAVVVLLALIVEDFIAFMKGENSLLGTILEKAGVDTEKFRQNVIKVWNNLKKILPAIWQGIKNVGIPVFQAIWAAVKTAFQAIGKILEWVAPKFADLLDNLANGEVDTAGWQKFGEVLGVIGTVILAVVAAVKAFTIVIKIVKAAQAAWAVVQAIVNASLWACPITWIIAAIIALIAIIVLLVTHWDEVKAAVQAVWDKVVGVFSNIANWFKTNVIDPIVNFFTGLWTSITSIVGSIKDAIVNGLTAAIDWIKGLPAQALQWGKDIIMGIVDGIKSAVSAVGDAVKGVASKIKSFLGFSEPEEGPLSDFHTYMPDMIDLMSKGINAGKDKIANALSDLTGDMSLIAKSSIVADATAAGVTNNSNVSKRVNQNVNINNTFNGDRAGQSKSSEAMRNASDDATSQMARALAFAR